MQLLPIAIEGTGTVDAAKALMDLPDLSDDGKYRMKPNAKEFWRPLPLSWALSAELWPPLSRSESDIRSGKRQPRATITKAVLVGNGKRVLLEGATIEEIMAVLESLG